MTALLALAAAIVPLWLLSAAGWALVTLAHLPWPVTA